MTTGGHKLKAIPLIFISALFLSACSSGGSSSSGADDAEPAAEADEADATQALTLSCKPTPKTAQNGDPVTASFVFSQSFVGSGVLRVATKGGIVTDITKVAISGKQLVVNRKVTSSIGETFVVSLDIENSKLNASCEWFVTALVQP